MSQLFFERVTRQCGDTYLSSDYGNRAAFGATQRAIGRLTGGVCSGRVLDAGCGTGRMTSPWVHGERAVGLDIVHESLTIARARLLAVRGDVAALPLRANLFNAVLSINALQSMEAREGLQTLGELVRAVAPGGKVVVVTLNARSVIRRLLRPKLGEGWYRMYSPVDIEQALTGAGVCQLRWLWLYLPLRVSFMTSSLHWSSMLLAPSFAVAGIKQRKRA